jgi:arylsulfatase A-like enzyme
MKRTAVILMLALLTCLQLQAKKISKPNVLVIYTDDHRYTGVHALGGEAVKTPNLDKLADRGIAFTNTYLMGSFSGATCKPSRAMLHTGRDLFKLDGTAHNLPTSHTTIGEAFMNSGYHAHFIGKWHNDFKSLARSFNSGGKLCGKPQYLTDQFRMPYSDWQEDGNYPREDCYLLEYDTQGEVLRRLITKDDKRGPTGTEITGPHVSEVLADEAANFIREYDKNQPFFMYLAFPCPHDPRQAPQKYHDMYPVDEIELTPSYLPQHPFDNGQQTIRDEKLAEWPRTPQIAKQHLSDYYSIITHLDAQIGHVIEVLKEKGLYENTLIIMAGDSGLGVGNHGLIGKQNIYNEDGIHVPFIISGGRIKKENQGRREDALCYIHDILPTICDMSGIPIPESVSGKSLLPVIDGEVKQVRDYTYHAYRQHQRAYRKGEYKLIEYVRAPDSDITRGEFVSGSRVTQLFNLAKDPWESLNLAYFPEYQEIVSSLRTEMKEKAIEFGDNPDGKRSTVDFWNYFE